jgi:hypothetical protein
MIHSLIKYIKPNLSKEPSHDNLNECALQNISPKHKLKKLASLQTNFRQMVNKWAMLMTW